tara:strand:- start:703 stop:1263 length:561 start_codon:yes stop_codon:yes gene_type:complete
MNINLTKIIKENISVAKSLLEEVSTIKKVCQISLKTIMSSKKIILCGNGGSASDSLHISSELVGKFYKNRRSLPSISLNSNISSITAIANDYGYNKIFSRQLESLGEKGDLLIAISTSGNSENVIDSVKTAISKDINVVAFTGKDGGKFNNYDIEILKVNSTNVARIQEMHILVGHIIANYLEENC